MKLCGWGVKVGWFIPLVDKRVCGLSANLECRSETCYTRLAGNTGPKKIVKNSPSGHHRTTLLGYIFASKERIDNRKNDLKRQYLPHMSSQ